MTQITQMTETKQGDDDDQIAQIAALCRHDPTQWISAAYDWGHADLSGINGPRVWQAEIANLITDHLSNPDTRQQPLQIAVASGHGIGKSAFMGLITSWALSCWRDARVLITANTMSQLRTKTAPEVAKWARRSITSHWLDVKSETIKIDGGWRADFVPWSANNTEAFAGLHNRGSIILILFDEAAAIDSAVWEVAEGALTDENTTIIWIAFGNPTRNTGRFRECFRRYRHRWETRHIDSRDVEGVNLDQLNRIVEDYGEDSDLVKVRVRGQFPSASMAQWISTADVDAARNRHLRPQDYDFAPVIIGVDPAWTGADTLEIFLRQGLYSEHLLSLAKNDNDVEVAQVIARFEDERKADAVFIDMGYGTGIKSVGDTMGRSWDIIPFAGKSGRADCLNKRMEIWYLMRDWLKKGGAIDPRDDVLYQDLIGPETVGRVDGIYQLESKKDMKSRGLPSPNRADALALTFSLPVLSRDQRFRDGLATQEFTDFDYNPIGD